MKPSMFRQNRIIIDLAAIKANYRLMEAHVGKGVGILAVVKADAYGHGIVEVAKTLVEAGAAGLAVAIPEEGILLRREGLSTNILVMGAATEWAAQACVEMFLTQTVFEPHMVVVLEQAAVRAGVPARVHIKVDTGMGRIGLQSEAEAEALAKALAEAPHVRVTGIYTHLADADTLDEQGGINAFTKLQLERFAAIRKYFRPDIPAHAANSAMALAGSEANFSSVRLGIALYGYPPVPAKEAFQPALRWEAEVVHVKTVAKGATIGYNCAFTAPKDMRVATVAVGYGDGYHRAISNRGQMLVHGKRAAILGRVCMDQTMIDVSDIPEAHVGSTAVLIGKQGDDGISAEEVARWANTISYEVLLSITGRVPRTYLPVLP